MSKSEKILLIIGGILSLSLVGGALLLFSIPTPQTKKVEPNEEQKVSAATIEKVSTPSPQTTIKPNSTAISLPQIFSDSYVTFTYPSSWNLVGQQNDKTNSVITDAIQDIEVHLYFANHSLETKEQIGEKYPNAEISEYATDKIKGYKYIVEREGAFWIYYQLVAPKNEETFQVNFKQTERDVEKEIEVENIIKSIKFNT